MSPTESSSAGDPDLRAAPEALKRAAEAASRNAIQTNNGIVVVRDEKRVLIYADDLRNGTEDERQS